MRNQIYVGQVIWNRRKMKNVPGTSKRIAEIRPKSEWIIEDHPELRIISGDLWNRVQTRLQEVRSKTPKGNKRSRGRPPRYLLSGLMQCGNCGANYIMRDNRSYICSSHLNGGKHLCDNGVTVRREVAEAAILENMKSRLLSKEAIRYIERRVKQALNEMERQPDDRTLLNGQLKLIDNKLVRITEAIEAVGISDTLTDRLTTLEQEKRETTAALQKVPAQMRFHPDIVRRVLDRLRQLVASVEDIGRSATLEQIERIRSDLRALVGTIKLELKDGVLWAYPNAKGPTEVRPFDRLHINSTFSGSGGRI